jgi:uncharacterized membrane protein YheB (UPF0754 family)
LLLRPAKRCSTIRHHHDICWSFSQLQQSVSTKYVFPNTVVPWISEQKSGIKEKQITTLCNTITDGVEIKSNTVCHTDRAVVFNCVPQNMWITKSVAR